MICYIRDPVSSSDDFLMTGRNGCGKSTFMKVIGARCFPIPDGNDVNLFYMTCVPLFTMRIYIFLSIMRTT